ncbi:hypothetical protein OJAV_G00220590 [Oryzias javanicus]|uniref:Uncharacterized protein n=1 Tax=Oryzias javanicus TaxID=123683 RepID=A0A437C1J8_ORYJA|nr:hypothetical protein OJAV_G00220590 [Oryzias javanicus]
MRKNFRLKTLSAKLSSKSSIRLFFIKVPPSLCDRRREVDPEMRSFSRSPSIASACSASSSCGRPRPESALTPSGRISSANLLPRKHFGPSLQEVGPTPLPRLPPPVRPRNGRPLS